MTIEQFWTILIKQWKLVVICFLFVGCGAFIGSKLITPLYQSSVLIQVDIRSSSSNQADYTSLLASDQLVQTESTLATSNPVLSEVASHYPGLTVTVLAGEVSSSPKTNTQLFEIDVVDPSPTRAANLANDIAATLIKQRLQTIQQDNLQAQQQIQQNLDQTSQQINGITVKIAALQAKKGSEGQIALLQAQLSGLQQHYSQWQNALAQLELTQAQSVNPLLVVQPAQPANKPARPNTLLNTGGGLLIGLLLGILLALLYERLDVRVRTPEELTRLLAWPVLATIWRAKSSKVVDVINPVGGNINTEPFRILRTNIGFSSLDKPMRSLIVTSAQPQDGKSTVAANLAIFMARAGKNTLLIDADLRRSTQHTLFQLTSDKLGLSNAVLAFSMPNTATLQLPDETFTAKPSLEPFVHTVDVPNLWVMPSGPLPPNPSELLESKVMKRFLAAVVNSGIEIVIFDAPPLLGLSDASILASKVDGALVVIDSTRATKDRLLKVKEALAQTGVHVLGCVANKIPYKRNDSTYDYYQAEHNSGEESAGNGHFPIISATPTSPRSPFEQKMHSN